ncbi:MAG: GH25 family lysozyme [Lapillicoccus sp.]
MRARRVLVPLLALLFVVTAAASASARIDGPDVSSYQHPTGVSVDWATAHGAGGADFAFVKATEGTGYTNPYFAKDYQALAGLKMVRGAYHFARPSTATGSAAAQARTFVSVAGTFSQHGELPPVLDLEVSGGLSSTALIAWTKSYVAEILRLTGRTTMIYTYPAFWRSAMADTAVFTAYPLWIATYGPSPQLVGGWPAWTFWQYTDQARVAGLPGLVDMSVYTGSLDALWALANGRYDSAAPSTPAAPSTRVSPTRTASLARSGNPASPVSPVSSVGFTGDARGDVIGRTANGDLYVYPGGDRTFGTPTRIGTGWNMFTDVVAPGDVTGDGRPDLVARTASGTLYLYAGNGTGGYTGTGTIVGAGWNAYRDLLTPGDLNRDGRADLLARTPDGDLVFFAGNGNGTFAAGRVVGHGGWSMFQDLITPGDVTGDGRPDLLARTASGSLYLYAGDGTGVLDYRGVIGTGFNRYSTVLSSGDLTGDGKADLVARTPANVNTIFVGNGLGAFTASTSFVAPWGDTTRIVGAR